MSNRNQNNVPTANKKANKAFFRNTRQGDVLPSSIEAFSRLTLDPATKAALTTAGAKLVVQIDSSGTNVYLADQINGQMLGGPEDLSKLGGIRSFVTRERKEALGIEIAKTIAAITYRANIMIRTNEPNFQQRKLDNSFGASVRPLLVTLGNITQNQKKLSENSNSELRDVFEPVIGDMFVRIRNAYFRLILSHVKGENEKGKLSELLLAEGVPDWVHSRFTSKTFVLDRNQELARVLFPSDPSKGLALTLKEWSHTSVQRALGRGILGNSRMLVKVLQSETFIRTICNIDESVALNDEINPSVAKMLRTKIGVIPPMSDSRYVTDPGSKSRAGWKFPTPSMDTPQGALAAVGIAFLRIYSANLQSVDLVSDYYHHIAPGAVSRAAVSPTSNFYAQWAASESPSEIWNQTLSVGTVREHRVNLYRWLRLEMRLSENGAAGKALHDCLDISVATTGEPPEVRLTEEAFVPPAAMPELARLTDNEKLSDLTRPLTDVEEPLAKAFRETTFTEVKSKKHAGTTAAHLSTLSKEGKKLVERLKSTSPDLAVRMSNWLRSFSEARIQKAAVRLANASFDELFVSEEDEHDSSSEDTDEDED